MSQNILKSGLKKGRISPIWGQSDPVEAKPDVSSGYLSSPFVNIWLALMISARFEYYLIYLILSGLQPLLADGKHIKLIFKLTGIFQTFNLKENNLTS